MKNWTICIAVVLALGAMGCGDKKKKRNRGGGSASDESAPPAAVDMPSVDGVTDYENKSVPSKTVTRSQKHNSKAVKLHKKKKYKRAVKEYRKALKINPRYEMARYNLACAYALMGDDEKALGLLQQLKAAGCYKCLERVIRAKSDSDFATLHQDGRFKSITDGISLPEPNYKKAAYRLSKGFKPALFQPTFDDGRAVRIVSVSTHRDNYSRYYDVKNVKQLDRRLKKLFDVKWYEQEMEDKYHLPWLIDTEVPEWTCTKNCCESGGEYYCQEGGPALLSKVCFLPLSADELLPTKIVFDDCAG